MSKQENSFPAFTDLGQQLIADKNGIVQQKLLDKINATLQKRESAIAEGLAPSEKERVDAERKALTAAQRIVSLFWHSIHNKNAPKAITEPS